MTEQEIIQQYRDMLKIDTQKVNRKKLLSSGEWFDFLDKIFEDKFDYQEKLKALGSSATSYQLGCLIEALTNKLKGRWGRKDFDDFKTDFETHKEIDLMIEAIQILSQCLK